METKNLTIYFHDYGKKERNYGELFDFLGEYDIITSSELGRDVVIMSGEVYKFAFGDEQTLMKKGKVTLAQISSLDDYIDKDNQEHLDFLKWYYNNN